MVYIRKALRKLRAIRLLALATLLGMPLLGWVICLIFDLDFPIVKWFLPQNFVEQSILGCVFGLLVGALASWITERKFMSGTREKYHKLFSGLRLTWFDVFFISVCAGLGEEILFRYALQSLIGIWLSAIIFVAIHGYLTPKNWQISVYGSFMVIAAAGFGYLAEEYGMLSAMIAHSMVDIYLLSQIKLSDKTHTFDPIEND